LITVNVATRPAGSLVSLSAARQGVVDGVAEIGTMLTRRTLFALAAGGTAAGLAAAWLHRGYSQALDAARARIAGYRATTINSRFGPLQYAEAGTGVPVLMIHGSGGGCDQGLLFAAPLVELGMRVISPSRFGYLGSAFPADPSSENQADAFVDLLDALDVDRIAVIGGSAGALSAIAFAIRHRDRCSALIPVVPATYVPDRPSARPWSPGQQHVVEAALGSDFLFWAAISAMPEMMIGSVLATDPALLAAASADERSRVQAILDAILPVSERAQGLLNDMRLAGDPQPMPLERITAPTLAISVEDDRYLTADAARHIAASVPGARLLLYPTGGHVWIGHNAEMFTAIRGFLKETAS
jgi:pimeloyl-ACP methyl ester carboxylesterase